MNSQNYKFYMLMVVLLPLFGCSTWSANRYSPKTENVVKLREVEGTKVAVGKFEPTPDFNKKKPWIMCRLAGPIKTPDGKPYHEYIRSALVDELKMAKAYSADAPVEITGKLKKIDFSSTSGEWTFTWDLESSNGKSLTVSSTHNYDSSMAAAVACSEGAKAFKPAVQDLITKTIKHKKFNDLLVSDKG
jgi:hypothetical protein